MISWMLLICFSSKPAAGSLALADQPAPQQHHMEMGTGAMPTQPGQDAFGAIQEIVRILEADPATDWSKVDLEALREHLIDMNEVTLHAAVVAASLRT